MTTNTYHHHLQGNSTWFPKNIFHDLTHVDLTHQGEHFRDPAQARPSMAISIKDQTATATSKTMFKNEDLVDAVFLNLLSHVHLKYLNFIQFHH